MTNCLDVPALGDFLRGQPPSVVIHDNTAPGPRDPSPPLDATDWLEHLADVLGCLPIELWEAGRITADDLAERGPIGRTARLIRSYGWETPPAPASERLHSPPDDPPHHVHESAASASPAWRQARDQYHGHLFGCPFCYAPTRRYCPTGAALRADYDLIPMESSA